MDKNIISYIITYFSHLMSHRKKLAYKLARTPYTKQCRFCGYSSYHIAAKFKLDNVFHLTGRGFYLLGEIIEGEINPGQLVDLKVLEINKDLKIAYVELADKQSNGKP